MRGTPWIRNALSLCALLLFQSCRSATPPTESSSVRILRRPAPIAGCNFRGVVESDSPPGSRSAERALRSKAAVLGADVVVLGNESAGSASGEAYSCGGRRGGTVTRRATGDFDVRLTPRPTSGASDAAIPGMMSVEKHYHGDLEAISRGEMLTAVTDVKDSAGYVAIERVTGTLQGRTGTFVLQHSGILNRGAQELTVVVVPDSGTGQLAGISGKMTGTITGGKHFYSLEYSIPERP